MSAIEPVAWQWHSKGSATDAWPESWSISMDPDVVRRVDAMQARGMFVEVRALFAAPPDRTPDARSTMAAQPAGDGWKALAADWLDKEAASQEATNQEYPRHAAYYPSWSERAKWWREAAKKLRNEIDPATLATSSDAPVAQSDARSTSDAAVVLCEARMSDGSPCTRTAGMNGLCGPHTAIDDEIAKRLGLADRATRSTDSSAEAHETWCVRQCDRLLADARWKTMNMFDQGARAALTILRDQCAEAAKLTTAPHTADETRVDGGAT